MRHALPILRNALYWGLPPVILYLIVSRIDVGRLAELAVRADLALIVLGVAFIVPKIVVGALRWHVLARSYECLRLPLGATIAEYWISLTLGVVGPGSLGSDAYRVALSGVQTGRYLRGAFVVGIEKVAALLSTALLIATIYPLLRLTTPPEYFRVTLDAAYIVIGGSLGIPVIVALARRSPWITGLMDSFVRKISALANRVEEKIRRGRERDRGVDRHPRELLVAAIKPRLLLPTLLLSIAIPVVGAIQAQIFLQALGHDLPFIANLIISPLILLALTLPISFGGLGIREGVFILFYGVFGVPPETALLVSFCSLAGALFGHTIGVLLYLARGRSRLLAESRTR